MTRWLVIMLLGSSGLLADQTYLSTPRSAKAALFSGATTALPQPWQDFTDNPAYSREYYRWNAGLSYQSFNEFFYLGHGFFHLQTGSPLGIGFFGSYLGSSSTTNAFVDYEETGGALDFESVEAGLNFSWAFSDDFSIGANTRYFQFKLAGGGASSAAADLGVRYRHRVWNWRRLYAGLALRNLGPQYQYKYDDLESETEAQPLTTAGSLSLPLLRWLLVFTEGQYSQAQGMGFGGGLVLFQRAYFSPVVSVAQRLGEFTMQTGIVGHVGKYHNVELVAATELVGATSLSRTLQFQLSYHGGLREKYAKPQKVQKKLMVAGKLRLGKGAGAIGAEKSDEALATITILPFVNNLKAKNLDWMQKVVGDNLNRSMQKKFEFNRVAYSKTQEIADEILKLRKEEELIAISEQIGAIEAVSSENAAWDDDEDEEDEEESYEDDDFDDEEGGEARPKPKAQKPPTAEPGLSARDQKRIAKLKARRKHVMSSAFTIADLDERDLYELAFRAKADIIVFGNFSKASCKGLKAQKAKKRKKKKRKKKKGKKGKAVKLAGKSACVNVNAFVFVKEVRRIVGKTRKRTAIDGRYFKAVEKMSNELIDQIYNYATTVPAEI